MANKDLTPYKNQHQSIQEEFKKQASSWGKREISPHLLWVIDRLGLQPHFEVLDVAAGNGLLSRTLAPHVKQVVAVDITSEMLAQGRVNAEQSGIANICFEQGIAENLPYPANAFDLVITRFSFHHFLHPEVVAQEMHRVCCAGGKVVVIDIVAPEDQSLAATYNHYERLRDTTHTEALSPSRLKAVVKQTGAEIIHDYMRDVEMDLHDWLDFTQTPSQERQQILEAVNQELKGDGKTGLQPFFHNNKLMFMHTWRIVVGTKR
jgi:ubiquinone/menaquinone biosynthesis C-methylase UbiE